MKSIRVSCCAAWFWLACSSSSGPEAGVGAAGSAGSGGGSAGATSPASGGSSSTLGGGTTAVGGSLPAAGMHGGTGGAHVEPSGGAANRGGAGAGGGTKAGGSTGLGGTTDAAGGGNGGRASGGTAGAQGGNPGGGAAAGNAGAGGGSNVPGIRVEGGQLLVDGKPYHIRGVCWNPVPKGKTHPAGLDFAGAAALDIPLMQRAGINTVRTYEPLTEPAVLDQLYAAGIRVLDSVYVYGGDATSVVADRVTKIKNHPAILAWLVGNEWNYNGLYVDLPAADAQARLVDAARKIRAIDASHPIATVYGELPSKALIDAMPEISMWGINSYRGIDFGDLFDKWQTLSQKPIFLAEYGADAYNAKAGKYDPESQAMAVTQLTRQIADHGSAFKAGGVAVGGAIFEWADEWWKDSSGSLDAQDVGGIAPGGGPYPDQTFNEEWWGLVDIDRKPRPAYEALKAVFATLPAP